MNDLVFPAHIRYDENKQKQIQTVFEHCLNVANYAKESLASIGLSNCAYLVGLLHDMGKSKSEFKDYIERVSAGENLARGSVVHSFTGCKYLLDNYSRRLQILTEILAYAIAAHHGLFDCVGPEVQVHGFLHRQKDDEKYVESVTNCFVESNFSENTISNLFSECEKEIKNFALKIKELVTKNDNLINETMFYYGLLVRLILSALIDADHRDSAEFENQQQKEKMVVDWAPILNHMEILLAEFNSDSQINKSRQVFSDKCKDLGNKANGVYRLNLPTGSGKTLASLRGALAHALKQGKKRIIYVMPLLTIIEQNADEIRKYVGKEYVLEHHSDVAIEDEGTYKNYKSLAEDWSSPVVVTTMVQFLNVLFKERSANIRRFQALVDSVVVIDEVQFVPTNMLSLFNLAINFLQKLTNTTFILCSATQPLFNSSMISYRMVDTEDIINYDKDLWKPFDRVKFCIIDEMSMEEVPDFLIDKIKDNPIGNICCICNTKREAAQICKSLVGRCKFYHLSAGMCSAHRKKVLAKIKEAIGTEQFVCITTQVIEAGVDISFQKILRFPAGIENVNQSAGRCNRHGELDKGYVYVIKTLIGENLTRLPEIEKRQDAMKDFLLVYSNKPDKFKSDITSDEAVAEYYGQLYKRLNYNSTEYPLLSLGTTIVDLLGYNKKYKLLSKKDNGIDYRLNQSFKTAAEVFSVFNENTYSVVVEYEDSVNILDEINKNNGKNVKYLRKLVHFLSPYVVNLFVYQVEQLQEINGLTEVELKDEEGSIISKLYVLSSHFYDENVGVAIENNQKGVCQ